MDDKKGKQIKATVRELYGQIAAQHTSCCQPSDEASSCCCGGEIEDISNAALLYSREELAAISTDIPSLGCGNPIALSELKKGETVLDLGSGGGLDCFLAAKNVGSNGRVIGLDMTPEMIKLARINADKMGVKNVEFRLGEMEHMPVDNESVDVIISNCVINLSPDKDVVFREAFRVLKPGGRLCVSDMVTHGELPESVRQDMTQWACCIGGAIDEKAYLQKIREAGFNKPVVVENKSGSAPGSCCGGNSIIASIAVKAFKPK
ncbi:MAG: arsenite methyltransferase [Dehalococcoidia bacterium]|jgi:ubiquinone/menaquinone biosynthesis C-methylase UbiE